VVENATLRDKFEYVSDGYYANGSWAKIRAIMRTKLMAIRSGKEIPAHAFDKLKEVPDVVEGGKKESRQVRVPVPDMRLTEQEILNLQDKGLISGMRGKGIRTQKKREKGRETTSKFASKRTVKATLKKVVGENRNTSPTGSPNPANPSQEEQDMDMAEVLEGYDEFGDSGSLADHNDGGSLEMEGDDRSEDGGSDEEGSMTMEDFRRLYDPRYRSSQSMSEGTTPGAEDFAEDK